MLLQTADHVPLPDPTEDDQRFRLSHHQILTCCLPDATWARSINPSVLLLDYVNVKPDDWARYVADTYGGGNLPLGCKNQLDQTGWDGYVLDEPFASPEGISLCCGIANSIAPRIVMPNFGDIGTYGSNRSDVQALRFLTRYHFVQVVQDTSHLTGPDDPAWRQALETLKTYLEQGKTIVAGIYDPNGVDPTVAAILSTSYAHPNLYWHYATAVPPAVGPSLTQWNPWWDLYRLNPLDFLS